MEVKLKLVDSVVRSFQVSKVFQENTRRINSFEFSSDGVYLISCSEDDQIVMYDTERGEFFKAINSKKYGADLVRFANGKTTAIHASTKVDNNIRYVCEVTTCSYEIQYPENNLLVSAVKILLEIPNR